MLLLSLMASKGVSTTLPHGKDFKVRFIYAYTNETAIMLQPKCWSCANAALVLRFETTSV